MNQKLVQVGQITFGDPRQFALIAGPCSVESLDQFSTVAQFVQKAGSLMLRGGIFKMRTNPEAFQGLGEAAFELVMNVKKQTGMSFVSEVTDARQIGPMSEVVDMFQVGSRNMFNYALLKELGRTRKPIMLKRSFSALLEEWLLAAEYVAREGNDQVILCERGIRTFENKMRNTLDLNAVAYVKAHSPWPIIVDPSHGTGRPEMIAPMSKAAAAAGADGVMIEVHPEPKEAKSDGFQALNLPAFAKLVEELKPVLAAVGKSLEPVK